MAAAAAAISAAKSGEHRELGHIQNQISNQTSRSTESSNSPSSSSGTTTGTNTSSSCSSVSQQNPLNPAKTFLMR